MQVKIKRHRSVGKFDGHKKTLIAQMRQQVT